jgi:ribosomal protein L37E
VSHTTCENCQHSLDKEMKLCGFCGFPHNGTKEEKIRYRAGLLKVKDLLEMSEKSIRSVFSLSLIFLFIALVVVAFSFIFQENHYQTAFFYTAVAIIYFLLGRFGRRSAYLAIVLTLVFYVGHTTAEFSTGMYPESPVALSESFTESKGATLIYNIIPMAYLVVRASLMLVLMRFLFFEIVLRGKSKMAGYLKGNTKK